MEITIVASPRSPHQLEHQTALAKGLAAHGVKAVLNLGGAINTPYVACWGWRHGEIYRKQGKDVIIMERGYLGDRFHWTSLAWNGLNGRATFPEYPADSSRFEKHFSMQPWKQGGDYVLIAGQVPGDASLQGINLMPWYTDAARKAREAYGLPVLFRPHPQVAARGYKQKPGHTEPSTGTLAEALAGAAVVITWNSNTGVDSVLAGVPTVTGDEGSMAREVTGHEIGEMVRPDREAWAHRLAWRQWTMDEIVSGEALVGLLKKGTLE